MWWVIRQIKERQANVHHNIYKIVLRFQTIIDLPFAVKSSLFTIEIEWNNVVSNKNGPNIKRNSIAECRGRAAR